MIRVWTVGRRPRRHIGVRRLLGWRLIVGLRHLLSFVLCQRRPILNRARAQVFDKRRASAVAVDWVAWRLASPCRLSQLAIDHSPESQRVFVLQRVRQERVRQVLIADRTQKPIDR